MARRKRDDLSNDDGVQDSFLDIIANIVGILILLVIVVGVRAAMQPQLEAEAESSSTSDAPQSLLTQAMLIEQQKQLDETKLEAGQLASKAQALSREVDQRDLDRIDLATYIATVDEQLEQKKALLGSAEAERLEVRSALAETDFQWRQLMMQKVALANQAAPTENIVHTPTPIVRGRIKKSLHLRLEDGRVAIVPLERLEKLTDDRGLGGVQRDLRRQDGVARLGPVDGFELYFVVITGMSPPGPRGIRRPIVFPAGEIRPGEGFVDYPIEQALEPNSAISSALKSVSPSDTAVTLWLYPDTAGNYRTLQQGLRNRGFAVDLRLLEEGTHIAFGPNGRDTTAQ